MQSSLPTIDQQRGLQQAQHELENELLTVHLCARGARQTTIRGIFGGNVVLSSVRKIYAHFHGDKKGYKTRSIAYYTQSALNRRHASLLVAMYRRMVKSGLRDLTIFVRVHEAYTESLAGDEILYDFDECYRLFSWVDGGRLRMERCPDCQNQVLMQEDEVRVSDCCHHCHPDMQSKTKQVRGEISIPDQQEIDSYANKIAYERSTAIELVLAGARPQEVGAMVPGMEDYARKLWPMLHGKGAPQGAHPFNPAHYIETIERRRQTSYIVKQFNRLRNSGLPLPKLLLAIFRDYIHAFGTENDMDFSRVRFITTLASRAELRLVRCNTCEGEYIILRDEIQGDQTCPVCRMLSHSKKAVAERISNVEPMIVVRHDGVVAVPMPGDAKRRRSQPKDPAIRVF